MPPPRPKLLGLATAVPGHVLPQPVVVAEARAVFADRRKDFERLESIFDNAGVATRYSVAPVEWFLEPRDWPARTDLYLKGASALYRQVVEAVLDEAALSAGEIDTVVTVSTTGIATPSLEARLLEVLGLRRDVRRVPVFGLGCAGGVAGLSLAARLAAAEPGKRVLVVAVELCTLAFRLDDISTRSIVAAALFGDGAAAAVLSCEEGGLAEIEHSAEHTWPETRDLMGWTVDPAGFGVVLAPSIPGFVEDALPAVAESFLSARGLSKADVSQFALHPGGAKVIAALETAFGLAPGTLAHERAVLADYGNMSSPTVLFVLRRALDHAVRGRGLMAALGPGFSAQLLTYEA